MGSNACSKSCLKSKPPATSSTSAVNANVNLTNVKLEEPTAAPYNSYQPQAGPLRTSSTEGAHIVLRDQEPSSLSPHIDPAKVPVPHCCADFLLYIKLAHDLFVLPLLGEFLLIFFPMRDHAGCKKTVHLNC